MIQSVKIVRRVNEIAGREQRLKEKGIDMTENVILTVRGHQTDLGEDATTELIAGALITIETANIIFCMMRLILKAVSSQAIRSRSARIE